MRKDRKEFCGHGFSRLVDERGNYSTHHDESKVLFFSTWLIKPSMRRTKFQKTANRTNWSKPYCKYASMPTACV